MHTRPLLPTRDVAMALVDFWGHAMDMGLSLNGLLFCSDCGWASCLARKGQPTTSKDEHTYTPRLYKQA